MSRRSLLIWLVAYLAMTALVVWGMFAVRERTFAALNTPEARAEWQQWRDEATRQASAGPVRRRVPKSPEPPALTLMRDYFHVMLGGSIFFGTVFFILLSWALQGAFARKPDGFDRKS